MLDEPACGELAGLQLQLLLAAQRGHAAERGAARERVAAGKRGWEVERRPVVRRHLGELPPAVVAAVRDAHVRARFVHKAGRVTIWRTKGRDTECRIAEVDDCVAPDSRVRLAGDVGATPPEEPEDKERDSQ